MSLGINSNLGAPKILVDKFLNLINLIQEKKCVKEVIVFTSIEAAGPRAEFIRDGLKTDYFWENVNKLLEQSATTTISIMSTFNALSITSFKEFFDQVVKLNIKYSNEVRYKPILIDISYLRHPELMTVKVLPSEYNQKMQEIVEHIKSKNFTLVGHPDRYYDLEEIKAQRLLEWMLTPTPSDHKATLQGLFFRYFTEYNARRNKNFLETFPEMAGFWNLCEKRSNEMKIREDLALFEKKITSQYEDTIYSYIFNKKTSYYLIKKPFYFLEYVYNHRIKKIFNKSDS